MSNLRDRLKIIKEQKSNEADTKEKIINNNQNESILINQGWKSCGYMTLKREVDAASPFKAVKKLPSALSVIVPDLCGRELPQLEDFVFFDLETTGLSGGAGTVAFLAAFGKLISGKLHITQYLLLDYPGQSDFLENVTDEFKNEKSVIVSYNGKCFDSQILKNMCLLNRIKPPQYCHADLLHPSRRLWKKIINDCSQSSIEANILGIQRNDDTPGSLAPEIWFEFVKSGITERLTGICDHNCSDITGLSCLLSAMISIAANPFSGKYKYDIERLALYWRQYIRRNESQLKGSELQITGEKLIRHCAEKNNPRSVYIYSYDLMRKHNYREAYKFTLKGLSLFEEDSIWHTKLLRRQERLKKLLN